MNRPIVSFLPLLLVFSLSLAAFVPAPAFAETAQPEGKSGLHLNEIGIGTGYAWGSLKGESGDISVYPAFVRLGFSANSLVGIKSARNILQLTIEPFLNAVSGPEDGVEAGCALGVRYLHEIASPLALYLEASVAPMYYSIDTVEQGAAGFNFLDQFGAGLQYRVAPAMAVFGGYRFRHLSHADLADRSNDGINTNALVLGFSWLY